MAFQPVADTPAREHNKPLKLPIPFHCLLLAEVLPTFYMGRGLLKEGNILRIKQVLPGNLEENAFLHAYIRSDRARFFQLPVGNRWLELVTFADLILISHYLYVSAYHYYQATRDINLQ